MSPPELRCLHVWDKRNTPCRMLKKARLLTRPTLARRDAPWPKQGHSAAADPRFTFHASRFTVPGSDARTKLADYFSILLDRLANLKHRCLIEIGAWRCFDRNLSIPVKHPPAIGTGMEIFRTFHV